ncbi:MAG: exodeoxyribonuclease VII large subunit [Muribaculaceae bacterium]|nr:exodeoxyribonuclease VII large subunit [Muribaculaceae bacterium]
MNPNNAVTLSQFQQLVGSALRSVPSLQRAWIMAELSDVRVSGGHCYMELIEKNDLGATVAKARAMIWASQFHALRSKFYAATGRDIVSGLKVMVCGSVNHHAIYGLSVTITDIDPSYTLGDMERIRREILDRLRREGIIDMNKHVELPPVAQRIAVISADGAAGYGDFINQLHANPEGFKLYPFLFRAVMQGDHTVSSVMNALDLVESTIDLWDCVVIIRGGGATTDLNSFDNYDLARRIAEFSLPVIVGIGHERDRTVLDEVANVRCKTPTAVAAFLLDRLRTAYSDVASLVERIARYSSDALRGEHHRLDNLETALPVAVHNRVMRERMRLNEYSSRVGRDAGGAVMRERGHLQTLAISLGQRMKSNVEKEKLRIARLDDMLRLLSPANTLRRGYSITLRDGRAVRDASELRPGDRIETRLADGTIKSIIE